MQPVCDGGGSEHALIRMARQLADAGWECHVAVPAPARLAAEYAAAGVRLHVVAMDRLTTSGSQARWAGYAARWPVTVGRLASLARRLDVDVVHSNSLHTWHGWAAARLARRPHVWHAREIVFQSTAALAVERFLTGHFADIVIAVSGPVADQLRRGPDGGGASPARSHGRVVVVHDMPDPVEFRPGLAGSFRRGAGIGDATPLVGSLSRLDTWKGIDVLLEAVPLIRARVPDAELVVAGAAVPGKEHYAEALRARASTTPGVHWLGHRDDAGAVMSDLDVFVQASTEPEPYGLVVAEALACGVPVVAGDAGGPPEILAQAASGAGHLVPPGDPVALADAVVALLEAGPSDSEERGRRSALLDVRPPDYAALFDEAAEAGPRHRHRHR